MGAQTSDAARCAGMRGTTGSSGCRTTTCCTTLSLRRVSCSWPTYPPSSPPAPDARAAAAAPCSALHCGKLQQLLYRPLEGAAWRPVKRAAHQPLPADMLPDRGEMTEHFRRQTTINVYWRNSLIYLHPNVCQLMLLRSIGRLQLLSNAGGKFPLRNCAWQLRSTVLYHARLWRMQEPALCSIFR